MGRNLGWGYRQHKIGHEMIITDVGRGNIKVHSTISFLFVHIEKVLIKHIFKAIILATM